MLGMFPSSPNNPADLDALGWLVIGLLWLWVLYLLLSNEPCIACGHVKAEHSSSEAEVCWGKPLVIRMNGQTPGCRCRGFRGAP